MKLFDGETAINEEAQEDVSIVDNDSDRLDAFRKIIEEKSDRFERCVNKIVAAIQWLPLLILINSLMIFESFFSGRSFGELWYCATFILSMAVTIVLCHILDTLTSNHRKYYKSVVCEILKRMNGGKK